MPLQKSSNVLLSDTGNAKIGERAACCRSPFSTIRPPVTSFERAAPSFVTAADWLSCLSLSSNLASNVHCRPATAPDRQHCPAAGDVGFAKVLDMTHLSQISGRGTFAWAAPEVGVADMVQYKRFWPDLTAALCAALRPSVCALSRR